MRTLILIIFMTLPLYWVGVFFGEKYVSHSHMLIGCAVLLGVTAFATGRYRIKKGHVSWALPFAAFLAAGVLGMVMSPYSGGVILKGGIQITGIGIMLLLSVFVVKELDKRPWFMARLASVTVISLGALAAVAVVQSAVNNIYGAPVVEFSFMDSVSGGKVWRDPGMIGALFRANSVFDEPAHFARALGLGLGLSLIRLGALGGTQKKDISAVVPWWAAALIVIGFAVSLSIIGYFLFAATGLLLWLVTRRPGARAFAGLILFLAALTGALVLVPLLLGPEFMEKLGTLSLLIDAGHGIRSVETKDISALAIAANMEVALNSFSLNPFLGGGLGSHPLAYKVFAPAYVGLVPGLDELNAQDAAALFLRLLSEAGIAGTVLFTSGSVLAVLRARGAILYAKKHDSNPTLVAVASGFTASFAGLFLADMGRYGVYYDPVFWLLLALTAGVPKVLSRHGSVR